MSNLVGETGKVVAFEPESYNFGVLGENVKINNRLNVVLEQKAVSILMALQNFTYLRKILACIG